MKAFAKFIVVSVLLLEITTLFVIQVFDESEQEKYYRNLNEDRMRADKSNQPSAELLMELKKQPFYNAISDNPDHPALNSNKVK